MRSPADLLLVLSTGLILLSLVAIAAILASARGAYAAPLEPVAAAAYTAPAPLGRYPLEI